MNRSSLVIVAVAACSSGDAAKSIPPPAPPPAPVPAPAGGGAHARVRDPGTPARLSDDDALRSTPAPRAVNPHPIDVALRSSPPGARAAVDGVPIGDTPTHYTFDADGQPHEFTFVKSGYALARSRFVPTTSGVVHVRLEAVAVDDVAPGDDETPPITEPPPRPIVPPAKPAVAPAPAPPQRPRTGPQP